MELFETKDIRDGKRSRPCHICLEKHECKFLCMTCWMKVCQGKSHVGSTDEELILAINKYIYTIIGPEIDLIILEPKHETV